MQHTYSLLCLGDSYTIGEGVPLHQSFPYKLLHNLRTKGLPMQAPEIVAQTGWTSFELAEHLHHHPLLPAYDAVTLLVGVNNQYRGLSVLDYAADFELLLKKAIAYGKHNPQRVVVISIPDWGGTPFAQGRDTQAIASEIDTFNAANAAIAAQYGTHYVEVTSISRQCHTAEWLVADGLHPAAGQYEKWVQVLMPQVISALGGHG